MSCLRVRARLYAKAVKMGLRDGGEGWLPRYAIQWRGGEGGQGGEGCSPPYYPHISHASRVFLWEGDARLISCPEFRTSENLHP